MSRGVIIFWMSAILAAQGVPMEWLSRGIGGGGALYKPAISPHNPEEWFLACDMSEVFHTTNAGASWTTVDFQQLQGGRLANVQFTADSNLLFCCNYRADTPPLPSRSGDGGRTWSIFPNAVWPTSRICYALFADPAATNRLLLASQTNLYVSTDGGGSLQFVMTYPGGSAPPGNRPGLHIAGVFWDGTNVTVGYNNGLLISTNGGATFSNQTLTGVASNEALLSLAAAREGANVRFFAVTSLTNAAYPDPVGQPFAAWRGFYARDGYAGAWVSRTSSLPASNTFALVAMCPTNTSLVYLAGRRPVFPNTAFYKSTDAGTNWVNTILISTNVVSGWAGVPSVCKVNWNVADDIAIDPRDPQRVLYADNGFLHGTTNGGASWRQLYLDRAFENPTNTVNPQNKAYRGIGLEPTVVVWLHWVDATNLLAGLSDLALLRSHDAGQTWAFDHTGLTNDECYHITAHPTQAVLYAGNHGATSPYLILGLDDVATDRRYGPLMRSTNGGAAWSPMKDFPGLPMWSTINPLRPDTLYVSLMNTTNGGVWVSSNIQLGASATWTWLGRHARANGRCFNVHALDDGTLVTTHSCRQLASGNFDTSSGLFVLPPGSTNWVDRSLSNFWYWCQNVTVDPWVPGQSNWYLCVWKAWGAWSNGTPNPFTQDGVYFTRDRGLNWTRIYSNDSCTTLDFDRNSPHTAWLSTAESGLFVCTNLHEAAPVFTVVTNYPFRQPMRVFFNPYVSNEVWVASNGNGLRVGTETRFNVTGPLGTPHAWMLAHGQTNELADADLDGLSAWQEYTADSDPLDPASRGPALTGFTGAALLVGPSSTARVYDVYAATDLVSNDWNFVTGGFPGLGTPLAIPLTNSAPARFYRAGVRVPGP